MSNAYEYIETLLSQYGPNVQDARDTFINSVVTFQDYEAMRQRSKYLQSVTRMGLAVCNQAVGWEDKIVVPLHTAEIPNRNIARDSILRIVQYERMARLHAWEVSCREATGAPIRRGFGSKANKLCKNGPVEQLAASYGWRRPHTLEDIDKRDWPRICEIIDIYSMSGSGLPNPRTINTDVFTAIMESQTYAEQNAFQCVVSPQEPPEYQSAM